MAGRSCPDIPRLSAMNPVPHVLMQEVVSWPE
jgi:hypothetical protein